MDYESKDAMKPNRWRKRPVEITAQRMAEPFEVKTMEGTMRGKAGDWLITGVQGEQYPCDDAIFRQTYESPNTESKSVDARTIERAISALRRAYPYMPGDAGREMVSEAADALVRDSEYQSITSGQISALMRAVTALSYTDGSDRARRLVDEANDVIRWLTERRGAASATEHQSVSGGAPEEIHMVFTSSGGVVLQEGLGQGCVVEWSVDRGNAVHSARELDELSPNDAPHAVHAYRLRTTECKSMPPGDALSRAHQLLGMFRGWIADEDEPDIEADIDEVQGMLQRAHTECRSVSLAAAILLRDAASVVGEEDPRLGGACEAMARRLEAGSTSEERHNAAVANVMFQDDSWGQDSEGDR
jgi:hypothetical protein